MTTCDILNFVMSKDEESNKREVKTDILSLTLDELTDYILKHGFQRFRAKQIFNWLHVQNIDDFALMKNIPKQMIVHMQETFYIPILTVEKKLVSQNDGTTKFLFKISEGEFIESVIMKYEYGNSICISTQIGCKMGCEFCASTKAGFLRNLTAGEMLSQIYAAKKQLGIKITNIVMMGIGEPLDNYDNTVRFLKLINDKDGENISLRNVSLSTCGIVDKIYELAKLKLGLTLSVSLHATDDVSRSEIMPINKTYNIKKLITACKDYSKATGRRISYEFALINGVNDSAKNAVELANLLKGSLCHVNIIGVNYVKEANFTSGGRKNLYEFQGKLKKLGVNATIRRSLGDDINAACGQLRRENQK